MFVAYINMLLYGRDSACYICLSFNSVVIIGCNDKVNVFSILHAFVHPVYTKRQSKSLTACILCVCLCVNSVCSKHHHHLCIVGFHRSLPLIKSNLHEACYVTSQGMAKAMLTGRRA